MTARKAACAALLPLAGRSWRWGAGATLIDEGSTPTLALPARGKGGPVNTLLGPLARNDGRKAACACTPPPCGEELEVQASAPLIIEAPAPPPWPSPQGGGNGANRSTQLLSSAARPRNDGEESGVRCSPPPCGEELEVGVQAPRLSLRRRHPHPGPPRKGEGTARTGQHSCWAPLRGPGMTVRKAACAALLPLAGRSWRWGCRRHAYR